MSDDDFEQLPTAQTVLAGDKLGWVAGDRETALVAVEDWSLGRFVFRFAVRRGRWVQVEAVLRLRGDLYPTVDEWRKLTKTARSKVGPAPKPRKRSSLRIVDLPDFTDPTTGEPLLTPGTYQAALHAFDEVPPKSDPPNVALALFAAAYVEATALRRGQPSRLIEALAGHSGLTEKSWRTRLTRAGERGIWAKGEAALSDKGVRLVEDYWASVGEADSKLHDALEVLEARRAHRLAQRQPPQRQTHDCFVSVRPGAPAHVARL